MSKVSVTVVQGKSKPMKSAIVELAKAIARQMAEDDFRKEKAA